jgi:predicted PurR-regulated permease PerM
MGFESDEESGSPRPANPPPSEPAHDTPRATQPHLVAVGLILLGVVGVTLLLWRLSQVIMLVFASIVVASILFRAASALERHTPLNSFWSKLVSWSAIAVGVAAFLFLLGSQVGMQLASLMESIPQLLNRLGSFVGIENLSGVVASELGQLFNQPDTFGSLASYTTGLLSAVGMTILVIFGGAFLAADPRLYRDGLATLFPPPWDRRVGKALDSAAHALSQWLLGKIIAMIVVGVATTLGLMLIGIPSALGLGVLAGLLEFIPLFGPALSAVPALLVALPEGMDKFLWVLALFLLIQQVESNLLVPVLQQRTAALPPVLGLFSIVAFGTLFGVTGVIVAAPVTVMLLALVKQLYVKDVLNRSTSPRTAKGKSE